MWKRSHLATVSISYWNYYFLFPRNFTDWLEWLLSLPVYLFRLFFKIYPIVVFGTLLSVINKKKKDVFLNIFLLIKPVFILLQEVLFSQSCIRDRHFYIKDIATNSHRHSKNYSWKTIFVIDIKHERFLRIYLTFY